jgi:hypothetical protein
MKHFKHTSWRKQLLAAALAAVLLLAAGCGAVSDTREGTGAEQSAATAAETRSTEQAAAPVQSAAAPESEVPSTEETERSPAATKPVLGVISEENERLNRFLTGFVQQEILDTRTELDEDAELLRFVFRYLQYNHPELVGEQEDGGTPCRTLTLDQVNETLNGLLGKTLAPDRTDYSILSDGTEEFHCVFHDGVFWHSAPYYSFSYGFPLFFALVDRIDAESDSVHFRFYKLNPQEWEIGEADRHVPVLPAMSFRDAERGPEIIRIGEGDAVLRDLNETDLQLVEFAIKLYR